MTMLEKPRVAYVLKVYPRFSQTFIVNEILAHQAASQAVDLFSLRRPNDGRFHQKLSQVTSPVHYLDQVPHASDEFLQQIHQTAESCPIVWDVLRDEPQATTVELYQAARLATAIRQQGIQHLHAHFGNTAAEVARLAAKIAEVSYSFTAHARDIFHETVNQAALERRVQEATRIVTVSQFNMDYLQTRFAPHASRMSLVYNGLNLDEFAYSPTMTRSPIILAVGRLIQKKGFATLIDACAKLIQQGHSQLQCHIIGSGPLENELRLRIHRHGLESQIRLLGALPSEEVQARLRQAALLAAPCEVAEDGDRDGLPTVLLEAMALGTPCVSTAVTGIPEVVFHGQTGLLTPPQDANALAVAMRSLLQDANLAKQVSQNARRLMETSFDIHTNTNQLRELFREAATSLAGAQS
ncbi:MAG: glycosyltransferase family 4 protein [Planctomycetales bacterium]|nr:glycosyltransferase family 4 protein [Planctomycetales bacterium]